jgi:hypothetical protein
MPEKINAVKMGLAGAVAWSLLIVSTALGAMFVYIDGKPWGEGFVWVMGTLYLGFGPTWPGVFIGLLWGLFDGFLAGFLIATVYNYLNRK